MVKMTRVSTAIFKTLKLLMDFRFSENGSKNKNDLHQFRSYSVLSSHLYEDTNEYFPGFLLDLTIYIILNILKCHFFDIPL